MKKSLKTFLAVLTALLPLVLTGCNQAGSIEKELSENARENAENKKKILAVESYFDESTSETDRAKAYAELASSIAGLELDTKYKLTTEYGTETFQIMTDGKAEYGNPWESTPGNIVALLVPPDEYSGIIIIIKSDTHSNWGKYQYPDYNENNPHSGCYTGFYLKDNGSSFYEAGTTWKVPGHEYTACAASLDYLKELFGKYGYTATCAGYCSEFPK